MPGRITINDVVFEVDAVPARMSDAVLADPDLLRLIWRDVYRWDARKQTGVLIGPVTRSGAVPLANALSCFVPRVAPGGQVLKNDQASSRMTERMTALVDAASAKEMLKSLGAIIQHPQKTMPLSLWSPLNPVAGYVLRLHVGYSVLQLRHPAEDLTAYLCLPSRVRFHHEIEAILNDAGYQTVLMQDPDLRHRAASFVVPSRSASNANLRKVALRKRIEDIRTAIDHFPPMKNADDGRRLDALRDSLGLLEEEWDVVTTGADTVGQT